MACTTADGRSGSLTVHTATDGAVTFTCGAAAAPPTPTPSPGEPAALAAFTANAGCCLQGETDVEAATVALAAPAGSDTFVAITSSDPSAIQIVGGGVVIPVGMTTGVVRVNAIAATAGTDLAASLGGQTLRVTIVVS